MNLAALSRWPCSIIPTWGLVRDSISSRAARLEQVCNIGSLWAGARRHLYIQAVEKYRQNLLSYSELQGVK